MKNIILLFGGFLISTLSFSQVGIGTINPAESSMLEVSSRTNGVGPYRGFMPPRIPDITARETILPNLEDAGLMVFIEDIGCLQLWNGHGWESVHCNNSIAFVNFFQNFDLNTTWGYTSDVPFFNNGTKGYFGITNSSNEGFNKITTLTNNFLGIMDLNDTEDGNGTSDYVTLTFSTIDVTAASNGATLSFNYEFYEYDGGDNAYYTVIIDGIEQPEVTLIEGENGGSVHNGISLNGIATEIIPAGTMTVSLKIRIKQDGQQDYAGFDNFALVAN